MDHQPTIITTIYDNGGRSADRYTACLQGGGALSLSTNPDHPLGISQYTDCTEGPHLGHLVAWANLPANIRAHLVKRCAD